MHDTIKVSAQPLKAHGEALATDGLRAIGLTGHSIGNTATGEQVMRARERTVANAVAAATVAGGNEGDTSRTIEIATSEGKTARVTLRVKGRRDSESTAEREHARLLGLDYASLGRAETKQIAALEADLSAVARYDIDRDGNPVPVRKLEGKAREIAEHRLTNARRSLKNAQIDAAAASVLQREHKQAQVRTLAEDTAEANRRAIESIREERIKGMAAIAARKALKSGLYGDKPAS